MKADSSKKQQKSKDRKEEEKPSRPPIVGVSMQTYVSLNERFQFVTQKNGWD